MGVNSKQYDGPRLACSNPTLPFQGRAKEGVIVRWRSGR